MPVYEFLCKTCNCIDELELKAAEAVKPQACVQCKRAMIRQYTPPQVITKGNEVPYLHPAFGTVMTDSQARREAKARGWEEVGTEDMSKQPAAPPSKSYDENDYFT
jgi:hypothetical protein